MRYREHRKKSRQTRVETVLIFDPDLAYAGQVAQILAKHPQRTIKTYLAGDEKRVLALLLAEEFPDLIILADNFLLSPEIRKLLLGQNILEKSKRRKPLKKDLIVQGMRSDEILRLVEQALLQAAPDGVSIKPLIFTYSFSPRIRYLWMQNFIRQQGKLGNPLYYFPFLPSYLVSPPLEFAQGPELSSLLLLLKSGARADHSGLGPCFQMQAEGFYALRTGGRAEDLMLAGRETQRQILSLFQKFIRTRSTPSLGLLEFAQIPLKDLGYLAKFADVFVGEIPQGQDYASKSARREIQILIHNLPEHTLFSEMDPYALHDQRRKKA